MKLLLRITLVMVLAFYSAAFLSMPAKADTTTIRSEDNEIWLSGGTGFFNYKEPASAATGYLSDSEQKWLPSIAAGISGLTKNNLYLALEGSYTFGKADYDGDACLTSYPYTCMPLKSQTKESISMVDGKVGYAFVLGSKVMLIPYGEFGYRYWNRNLGAGQVEDYDNFDALGGLMLQVSPTNKLVFSLYGSAGTTISPEAKSATDTFNLGNATMCKAGGKIGYDLTQHVELFTTLDYDHFHYVQSAVQPDGYFEPDSHTDETAIRIGVAYHFS